jgi:hypothetical protein
VIQSCGFLFIPDISASKVQAYLAGRRQKGLSIRSSNFYLQAVKQFCNWLVADSRTAESPVAYLKGQNPKIDIRHARRALEPDEMRRLLETTAAGPVRFGMSGLYWFSVNRTNPLFCYETFLALGKPFRAVMKPCIVFVALLQGAVLFSPSPSYEGGK